MGVEYKHYLLPKDPTFVAAKESIARLDAVMVKWGLKMDTPVVFDVTDLNNPVSLSDTPLESLTVGHGIAIEYPTSKGPATGKVTDPHRDFSSYHHGGYFQVTLITGTDYRIQPETEGLFIDYGTDVIAEDSLPYRPFGHYSYYSGVYIAEKDTPPPPVKLHCSYVDELEHFYGYWRTAVIIDFGKCLPETMFLYKLGNREFVQDVEAALGTMVTELGEVY